MAVFPSNRTTNGRPRLFNATAGIEYAETIFPVDVRGGPFVAVRPFEFSPCQLSFCTVFKSVGIYPIGYKMGGRLFPKQDR